MFKPATQVKKSLKIAVYGEAGTGKTWFALQALGKKAVIDTENGTDFYGTKFDFDVLKTRSYRDVVKALDHIEQANQYDVLVIDPITNIYQTLKDSAQLSAEKRAKLKKRDEDDVNLTFRDWGIIKNKFNSLISRLCNLPCHVIITGWQKDVYEGTGDNMRKVGTRPDADRKIEYQPDVIIQLVVDKHGNRFGIIEKDRTMTYQKGQRVKDISFNNFIGSVHTEGEESKIQTEEEAAENEYYSLSQEEIEERKKKGHSELHKLAKGSRTGQKSLTEEEFRAVLKAEMKVESVTELDLNQLVSAYKFFGKHTKEELQEIAQAHIIHTQEKQQGGVA